LTSGRRCGPHTQNIPTRRRPGFSDGALDLSSPRSARLRGFFSSRFPPPFSSGLLPQEEPGPPGSGFPGCRRTRGAEDLRKEKINRGDAQSAEKKKRRGTPTPDRRNVPTGESSAWRPPGLGGGLSVLIFSASPRLRGLFFFRFPPPCPGIAPRFEGPAPPWSRLPRGPRRGSNAHESRKPLFF